MDALNNTGKQGAITEVIDSNLLIFSGGVFKNYSKGEYIFHEGEQARFYHQVVEGRIKMVSITENGNEFIQGFFSAGQSFGEPPLFDGEEYPSSAIAVNPSVILRLNIPAFIHLLKENFNVHLNITKVLSERIKNKANILKDICFHSPEQRILTLLNSIKKEACLNTSSSKIIIDYTRKQIADMSGLRVETVIRVMRGLHNKGAITIEKGKVFY